MAAVLVYQVASIHHMQSINKNLSGLNFSAARTSIQLMRDRDLVEEYTKKSFIVGDPDYVEKLREFKEGFASSLQDMQYLGRSEREQVEINRLVQFWEEFSQALARELAVLTPGTMPSELDQHLERLRAQVQTVHQVSLRTIEAEVGKAADTGAKAEWISWSAAAIALVVSFLVSFFIVRSISEPLHHLTEGTRAVAEGKFYYRLDASRNDEFALLAKDFNTMTARLNELDQMKKDFVSHVSHELKGPLASMQETTHMLLEEIPGWCPACAGPASETPARSESPEQQAAFIHAREPPGYVKAGSGCDGVRADNTGTGGPHTNCCLAARTPGAREDDTRRAGPPGKAIDCGVRRRPNHSGLK